MRCLRCSKRNPVGFVALKWMNLEKLQLSIQSSQFHLPQLNFDLSSIVPAALKIACDYIPIQAGGWSPWLSKDKAGRNSRASPPWRLRAAGWSKGRGSSWAGAIPSASVSFGLHHPEMSGKDIGAFGTDVSLVTTMFKSLNFEPHCCAKTCFAKQ